MHNKKYFLLVSLIILSVLFTSCSKTNTAKVTETTQVETSVKESEPPKKPDGPPPNGEKPDGPMPEEEKAKINYKAVNHYNTNQSVDELVLTSSGQDESAVLVDGNAVVNLNDFQITRSNGKSSGGDTASFYGVGATTLVTSGTLNLNEGAISTNAKGAAGVFAYGKGIANVNGATIETKQDTSGGIHVAGGGTLNATELTVTTNGESSAAIRSDRGGGTMTVNGGTYISNGHGSPAIYCTANITAKDATLVANNSEGICIEGLNTITLNSVELTSNMPDQSQNDNTWSVIVYQSMSGDSKIGKGTFNMNEGVLTSMNGGIFYTTNTESEFNIKSVEIKPSQDFEYLLRVTGNQNKRGWGKVGSNGAKCTFNAIDQEMNGKIIYDSISTLNLNLTNGTVYTGYIVKDDSATGGSNAGGYANVTIDNGSEWIVTNDSVIGILTVKDSKNFENHVKDKDDKEVKILDANGNVLRDGESDIKITVAELQLQ